MRLAVAALAAITAGCASVASPPGGPDDEVAPSVVRVTPDSGATSFTAGRVLFHFDEVVSDRGTGTAALERLVVISPSVGPPRISWHRDAIGARPREGWRPNTTYSVTLLPGIRDLRGNVTTEPRTIVFSTGPALASSFIEGQIFDWLAERPAARGWVVAFPSTDSTMLYAGPADSSGRFSLGPLDAGSYTVRGWLDANANRTHDRVEASDTAVVTVATSARVSVELLAALRDTLPARIATATPADSVTIVVTFDRPLDPASPPTAASFRIVRADSTPVRVVSVMGGREFDRQRAVEDSLRRADTARVDTARAARPADVQPRAVTDADAQVATGPSRSPPNTSIAIRVAQPLEAGATYRVEADGVRSLGGRAEASSRVFTLPAPQQAPPDQTPPPDEQPGRGPAPGELPVGTRDHGAPPGRPTSRP
jgi:hypothetical protein